MASKTFKGIIDVDIRKSTPDWEPYEQPKAPAGAPNSRCGMGSGISLCGCSSRYLKTSAKPPVPSSPRYSYPARTGGGDGVRVT